MNVETAQEEKETSTEEVKETEHLRSLKLKTR